MEIDCRSREGRLTGLIDIFVTLCNEMDANPWTVAEWNHPAVIEALKDLDSTTHFQVLKTMTRMANVSDNESKA
jgi:hypothetical protein